MGPSRIELGWEYLLRSQSELRASNTNTITRGSLLGYYQESRMKVGCEYLLVSQSGYRAANIKHQKQVQGVAYWGITESPE